MLLPETLKFSLFDFTLHCRFSIVNTSAFFGRNIFLVCFFSSSRELLHMFELTSVGNFFVSAKVTWLLQAKKWSEKKLFEVREKSGNFTLCQGKFIF